VEGKVAFIRKSASVMRLEKNNHACGASKMPLSPILRTL
jgi:hypothetical protein